MTTAFSADGVPSPAWAGARPPRLVATDLDGTLLRSDGTISPRTADVIAELDGAGVDVVFVTARPPEWLDELAGAVGSHSTAICANGAFVYDVARRTILESDVLAPELVASVTAELRAALPAASFAIQGPGGLLSEARFPLLWPSAPTWRVAEEVEAFLDVPIAKLMVQCAVTPSSSFLARVDEVLAGRATVSHSGEPRLAEVSAAGVTKAATLGRWCAHRGVGAAEVWAFGDMPNDLDMLAWAGTSFAVAGAHADVLATADHVVGGNDDDGVAEVLATVLDLVRG